eukprot:TRINITY_DN17843_c0_g1_i1.p1 TRINITY_DN17843_c0_g1~~TRINITY_DN17843_c0_g1_i1.p1  ORF type:complete len:390 (+),score=95.04 TRINITY_DN17843_c0_g1_i1:52-1170(+)
MGLCKCCFNCCSLLVLAVALLIGYINTYEHVLAPVFIAVFKLQGLGKPMTEAVPDDMKPKPRPGGEFSLELPGGGQMPANGIGMCCRPTAYDDDSVYNTVLWYLLEGGRHIDTAAYYMNHKPIGRAMKEAMRRGIPRSEIFVVTKVPPDTFGYDSAMEKVPRMAKELDVDYIDLVLMHAPRNFSPKFFWSMYFGGDEFSSFSCGSQKKCLQNTWKAFSELREQGVMREGGVSNFNIEHMQYLMSMNLAPIAANQLQYHPWAPEWQQEVVAFCNKHKIAVTAYFSLGGIQNKDKAADLELLKGIGGAHKVSSSQVLLRWALEKNISIIPGTGNPKHMRENLGIYGFSLSADEMSSIDKLKSNPIKDDFMWVKF